MDTYEKKYKEALGKARYYYEKGYFMINAATLENIFHELAESEDDKIRKELLEHCINRIDGKQVCVDASDYRRWADWLFRQTVENIPNVKSDKEISNEIIKFLELPHPQFVGKRHQEDWIAWLEKQGEKKPTDKVEPKFHEGEWVIDKQGIMHQIAKVIENVTNHTYGYDIVGGGYFNDNTEGVRLWTIQDAKDGDVLVGSYGTFIFMGESDGYCGVLNNNTFIRSTGNNEWTEGLHPATKEQRDTLLKAMADAGYTFDFEKRELKKIEQKPAWNEEDEDILNNIVVELEAVRDNLGKISYPAYNRLIDWLKSLKNRYTWKPSNEQMETLKEATNIVGSKYKSCLNSLYSDLKKLK